MALNIAAWSGASMRCPRPVRSRARSASPTPNAPSTAAKLLGIGSGLNTGPSTSSGGVKNPVSAPTALSQPRALRLGWPSP